MRKIWLALVALPVLLAAAALLWAMRHPALDPVPPPDPADFDRALLRQGEALAGIGDCVVCHTAAGGEPFAGGLPLPTPFGVVHATNITPDPATGIGNWSQAAFLRAMREGVDRGGRHLYPVFPYDHFTRVREADLRAIYAYLMSLAPVEQVNPANDLVFPLNQRLLLAGWKLLFLDTGEYQPDPDRSEEWNRGAYLAEGLAHCGACHSPRNVFGAVVQGRAFAGGEAEEWHAPALDTGAPGPVPWTQLQLVNYLFDGWDAEHGIAAGPMAPVVNHLYDQSEDDVFAIAAYIESWQRPALSEAGLAAVRERAQALDFADTPGYEPERRPDSPSLQRGLEVFRDQCAHCHKRGEGGALPVSLALTGTVNAPDARNVIHIVFDGIRPPRGALQRSMPGFGASITDAEITDLVAFLRWHFTDHPPWAGVAEQVAATRAHW